jgi:dienelactone hydrolase
MIMRFDRLQPSAGMAAAFAALLASALPAQTSAAEPFRLLTPSGASRHPAVLLVSGCSGFIAVNGVNLYEERAAELQAAGYVVVFVDYLGRRNLKNCSGQVSRIQVGQDILEAAAWMRARPNVDPARISAIGWSYGGGGVIAALTAMPLGGAGLLEGGHVLSRLPRSGALVGYRCLGSDVFGRHR